MGLSIRLNISQYDRTLRGWLLNQTAGLIGFDVHRLSATPEEEVVARADGHLDIEIIIDDAEEDGRRGVASKLAGERGHTKRAAEAARELVAYGGARLSYYLLLPISSVQLVGIYANDELTGQGGHALMWQTWVLITTAALIALLAGRWLRRSCARRGHTRPGGESFAHGCSAGHGRGTTGAPSSPRVWARSKERSRSSEERSSFLQGASTSSSYAQ